MTMTKDFQKPANSLQELPLRHPGIIDADDFNKHFQLHCYKPTPDLEPFVEHIWVQRQRQPFPPLPKPPIEILSGPNIYLFFTKQTAFIHSITRHAFEYDAFASPVIAGVKFRPGGFYPFLHMPVSELDTNMPAITSIFPGATKTFRKALLNQSDEIIVSGLETLLQSRQPEGNKSLELVTKILCALDTDPSLRTVGSIARAFHISERSLQLLFRTHVGVGLKWVINRKRLLETIGQVKERSRSSQAEVAAELGYNSQSHFTREFKNTTGQLPSRYLKSGKTSI
jgi:AraC-like DNA-binding protein